MEEQPIEHYPSNIVSENWQNFFRLHCQLDRDEEQLKALCQSCNVPYDENLMKLIEIQEKEFKNRMQTWANRFIHTKYFSTRYEWLEKALPEDVIIDTIVRAQEIVETEKKLMHLIETNPGCKSSWNNILVQLRLMS